MKVTKAPHKVANSRRSSNPQKSGIIITSDRKVTSTM
jgi:hypothetical protein